MKLAYCSASIVPSTAANSIQVLKMCDALAELGHDVTLVCAEPSTGAASEPLAPYGIEPRFEVICLRRRPQRHLPPWPRGEPAFSRRVASALAGRHFDLLYGRNPFLLAHLLRKGVPVILELHAPPARARGLGLPRTVADGTFCEERALRRVLRSRYCIGVVAITQKLKAEVLRQHPFLVEDRVIVEPDATDLPPPPEDDHATAAHGHRAADRLQVGYVGHLYPGKGAEILVPLAGCLPDVDIHVFGGTKEDLRRLVPPAAQYANLVFHGFIPHRDVADVLRRFDVLVAPYQGRVAVSGGRGDVAEWMSPLKIFEYMASGRPIVASRLPVLQEVLEDGRNAVLVEPDRLSEWCRALEHLRADPALRQRLAQAALVDVKRYTWVGRAERILAAAGG